MEMEIVNPDGLSDEQRKKLANPYAHNTQREVNYNAAKEKLAEHYNSADNPLEKILARLDSVEE